MTLNQNLYTPGLPTTLDCQDRYVSCDDHEDYCCIVGGMEYVKWDPDEDRCYMNIRSYYRHTVLLWMTSLTCITGVYRVFRKSIHPPHSFLEPSQIWENEIRDNRIRSPKYGRTYPKISKYARIVSKNFTPFGRDMGEWDMGEWERIAQHMGEFTPFSHIIIWENRKLCGPPPPSYDKVFRKPVQYTPITRQWLSCHGGEGILTFWTPCTIETIRCHKSYDTIKGFHFPGLVTLQRT